MGRLTGIRVVKHLHASPGFGKGEADGLFGRLMQELMFVMGNMKRECAADLYKQMEKAKIAYNLHISPSRKLFKPGSGATIPHLSQCASFEFPVTGGVIMREIDGMGEG